MKKVVSNLFIAAPLLKPDMTVRSEIGSTMQLLAVRPWDRSIVWATVMDILPTWQGEWDNNAQRILEKYRSFADLIVRLDLPAAIDRDPLIDVSDRDDRADRQGTELQKALNIRPSRLLFAILNAINVWQLDNPTASRGDCLEWVHEMWRGEGRAQWEAAATAPAGSTRR